MEAKEKIEILIPQPIEVTLNGQKLLVKKMTVMQQFKVGKLYEGKTNNQEATREDMAQNMLAVISLATGIPSENLDEGCDVIEINAAFKAIWEQNGFDRFKKPAEKSATA